MTSSGRRRRARAGRGVRMLERADRAVERGRIPGRCRSGCPPAGRTSGCISASAGSLQSADHHRLALPPALSGGCGHVLAAGHVGDAGLALPPELVRVADAAHRAHQLRGGHVGHVPGLVTRARAPLDVAQQVDLAGLPPGRCEPRHMRAICACPPGDRYRDVELLDRLLRIGDVDDHRAVQFHRAARLQRIGLAAAVRADEGDRPSVRIDDHVRLVRRSPLEVDVSYPAHVLLFAALADVVRERCARAQCESRHRRCKRRDAALPGILTA